MTTVADIAARAFNAVSAAITDAIPAATITRTVQGLYDPEQDVYDTTTETQTGRAVISDERPKQDAFPAFVIGPQDELILLEGFTSVRENDVLTIGGVDRTVMAVQDIVGAGVLFNVVAR